MKKFIVAVLLICVLLRLLGIQVIPASLSITATNVTDLCVVSWPNAALVSASGGYGTPQVSSYDGPAFQLAAIGLFGDERFFIESSPDLTNWTAYPQENFQLTLSSTNPTVVVPNYGSNTFYRARMGLAQ